MPAFATRGLALALFVLALGACLGTSRPDAADWLPQWQTMVELVPEQGDLGEPPDQDLCQTTLAGIRERSEELLPTPSRTVDELVEEWVAIAEAAFFECPPGGEEIASFEDAYQQLDTVEESVLSTLEESG